jgi:hypothetical protein
MNMSSDLGSSSFQANQEL